MHAKGSCMCGKSSYTLEGEPVMTALCHCLNCRKLTSSLYSHTLLLPADALTYTSASPLKKITTQHHEEKFDMTVFFCSECGSALSKEADKEGLRGLVIVFAGCLDEPKGWLEEVKPGAEMWTKYRVGWRGEVEGSKQCVGFA